MLVLLNDLPAAIDDYAHLIKASPQDVGLLFERGNCLLQAKDPDRAKADFEAAARLNAEEALAWHLKQSQQFELNHDMMSELPHLDACIAIQKGKPGEADQLLRRGAVSEPWVGRKLLLRISSARRN